MDYQAACDLVKRHRHSPQRGLPRPYFLKAYMSPSRPARILLKPGTGKKFPYDFFAPLCFGHSSLESSHLAVMVDIYNKVVVHDVDDQALLEMLTGLTDFQSPFSFGDLDPRLQSYRPGTPATEEMSEAARRATIGTEEHTYDPGHNSVDYYMDELFHLIFWIAVQEELNYGKPSGRVPEGKGRLLPLYRYVEAVEAGRRKDLLALEKYGHGACNRRRPPPPLDASIQWGFYRRGFEADREAGWY